MRRMQRDNRRICAAWLAGAAMAALVLALPLPAHATVDCSTVVPGSTTDTDADGFTDYEECTGIGGLTSCGAAVTDRATCLDPSSKDVFVILVPASPSNFPANLLELVTKPASLGGLGLAVHVITPDQVLADRTVLNSVLNQKAISVTESLDPTGSILGISNWGTPNGLDGIIIYTARIINFLTSVYGGLASVPLNVRDLYIKNSVAHEFGHDVATTTIYDARFNGHHYKSGTKVVMEESVTYTVKGGNVTFYITGNFTSADQSGVVLK